MLFSYARQARGERRRSRVHRAIEKMISHARLSYRTTVHCSRQQHLREYRVEVHVTMLPCYYIKSELAMHA